MGTFRKKSIEILAFRFGFETPPDWFIEELENGIVEVKHQGSRQKMTCEIHTLKGVVTANHGDYIIWNGKDEIYPCKADIFEETYEDSSPY